MKSNGDKKQMRVYACYLLQGDPVDVLSTVQRSLDALSKARKRCQKKGAFDRKPIVCKED